MIKESGLIGIWEDLSDDMTISDDNVNLCQPMLRPINNDNYFLGEAVFARCLSSLKPERVEASSQLSSPAQTTYDGDKAEFVEHIRKVINSVIL